MFNRAYDGALHAARQGAGKKEGRFGTEGHDWFEPP